MLPVKDRRVGEIGAVFEAFILTQDVEVDFVAHRNASSNVKNLKGVLLKGFVRRH
jgi:hypothetical protein